MNLPDISWKNLRTYTGSKQKGFEQLCCQLARTVCDREWPRHRSGIHDAGVEIFASIPGDREWGWQAKYPDRLEDAWGQIDASVRTAIEKHPQLVRYYICMPFDLGDARVDRRMSQKDKWDGYCGRWKELARTLGREIEFTYWGSHELFELLALPENIGTLRHWFDIDWIDRAFRLVWKDWPTPSQRKRWVGAVVSLAILALIPTYVIASVATKNISAAIDHRAEVARDLQSIQNELTAIEGAYAECQHSLERQYSFATEISSCKENVDRYFLLQKENIPTLIRSLDPETFSDIDELFRLMREFNDRISAAYTETLGFEDESAQQFRNFCPNSKKKPDFKRLREYAESAFQRQTQAYMVVRTFMLPGIEKSMDYVDVLSMRNTYFGLLPFSQEKLTATAHLISRKLTEGKKYLFKETKFPFTDAKMKAWLSENFMMGENEVNLEDMRWQKFSKIFLLENLKGRKADVRQLIDCGLLAEVAYNPLSNDSPKGENVSESMELSALPAPPATENQ